VRGVQGRFLRTSAPTSIDGIERYLSSGMIRGIGKVIEMQPDRLREVEGIGAVRDKGIVAA
jgi:exodeoxyribonuclease V alpha subunit